MAENLSDPIYVRLQCGSLVRTMAEPFVGFDGRTESKL
jgi:hypothetical protein